MSHEARQESAALTDGFDAYAGTYDDAVNESLSFLGVKVDYFTKVKAGYVADLLSARFGDTKRVDMLDVGCGVGNFHQLVGPAVASLSGCDVSAECLKVAGERNSGVTYRHYDGALLPFADASFDAVMTVCVMHHVPPAQWPSFTREMRRVLRPGGLAMVFEHNPLNPLTRRVVSNCEFDADAVLLGQQRTRGLLRDAGFGSISSRTILSIPTAGPISRRLDAAIGVLPFGAQYYVAAVA